jgi:hypothetical protein
MSNIIMGRCVARITGIKGQVVEWTVLVQIAGPRIEGLRGDFLISIRLKRYQHY